MQTNTPTTAQRLAALVASVQAEELECGAPEDQLSTADRFTHDGGDTFRVWDNPGRSFALRVLTIDEASDANIGTNFTFAHGGLCWVITE